MTSSTPEASVNEPANVGAPMVSLEAASVRYGRHDVLDKVSFSADAGQLVGVRGINGSGKTTLLRLLANIFRPSSGLRVGPSSCAYVPGSLTAPPMSSQAWLHGMPGASERSATFGPALETLGFDGDLTGSCRALSFGNLRKLVLVEAFTSGEKLLVIDEASAGLDDRGIAGLQSMIAGALDTGATVILADQESRPIPQASRLVRIEEGGVHDVAVDRLGPAPPSVDAELTMRGPQARLAEFLSVAKGYGFHRTGPDQ